MSVRRAQGDTESTPIEPGHSVLYHPFPVGGIDAMSASTTRSFPRHTHDQYGIGLLDRGGHSSWSGKGQVEAGPGSFISVNPGEVHDGRAVGRQSRSWRILYFDPRVMDDSLRDVLEGRHASFEFSAPVFADGVMRGLFEEAFAHTSIQRREGGPMASETAVLRLVARLSRHAAARQRREVTSVGSMAQILRRIDADPGYGFTLAELANEARLSRYQLIRAFAKATGLPPHAYILQRRLALARRLLRSRHGLAETAALAGFFDQSHLTRCFSRQFGVTPRRYAVLER